MLRTGVISPAFSVSLAHAIVLASDTPLLLVGADATVMAASRSFCSSFGIDPAQATLAPLSSFGLGEWDMPRLGALLQAIASGVTAVEDLEVELLREGHPARHLVIAAQKLNYPGDEGPMILLSITDITEVHRRDRQKDALLQEKVVLLEELQHRIANSLQIIASVLLQSARTAQSDDARSSIKQAHHRVMSVAALQRQLAVSQLQDVDLGIYLAGLCRSIGTSMIPDPSVLSIEVDAVHSFVKADVSLSLGLIVTELVINAIKHAYPGGRGGKIVIRYTTFGKGWSLTVSDDGLGMRAKPASARPGLGSDIVTALAAQLDAAITVSTASPGTLVSIRHEVENIAGARPVLAAV